MKKRAEMGGYTVLEKKYDGFFKVLSEPLRLKVIELLTEKEFCVCDLVKSLDISQPLLSHHLQILKKAHIVNDRRAGKWIYYRLNPTALQELTSYIDSVLNRYRRHHESEVLPAKH